jgi:hypothetical protein
VILHDERSGVRRHAALPVVNRGFPHDLAVRAVQRDQPRVEPRDNDEIARERHAATDRPAAQHGVETIPVFGLVAPENVAGLRVDGEGAGVVGRTARRWTSPTRARAWMRFRE